MAEYAVALMLSLNRKIYRAVNRTRDGNFKLKGLLGFDMYDKTAGLIGMGRIAKELIKILRGFGMNVLAYDLYPDHEFAKQYDVKVVELDELYAQSDIISLHCPLTPETKHIINTQSIAKMKPGVMIINTGRGQLINTEDLIEGLRTKRIGSAGLDVYEEEKNYFYEDRSDKMIDDDVLARLLMVPNVVLTSHQAFFTEEALHNIALTTLGSIKELEQGLPLTTRWKADPRCNSTKLETSPPRSFPKTRRGGLFLPSQACADHSAFPPPGCPTCRSGGGAVQQKKSRCFAKKPPRNPKNSPTFAKK